MDHEEAAANLLEILRANPDGISRVGLMAWARLRVSPDLTDEQLDAALATIGAAIATDGAFIRISRDRPPGRGHEPPRWPMRPLQAVIDRRDDEDQRTAEESAGWIAGSAVSSPVRVLLVALGVVAFAVSLYVSSGTGAGPSPVPASVPEATGGAIATESASGTPTGPPGSMASVDTLGIGSCFNMPEAIDIGDVLILPCEASHDGEVVSVFDYQGPGGSYPTDEEWGIALEERCESDVDAYTGLTLASQGELAVTWFVPTLEGWQFGTREIYCILVSADSSPLERSFRRESS